MRKQMIYYIDCVQTNDIKLGILDKYKYLKPFNCLQMND